MSANPPSPDGAMPEEGPSRAEVVAVIDQVLAGTLSREDASNWALPCADTVWPDEAVEDALSLMLVFYAPQTDWDGNVNGYCHTLDQLAEVREPLLAASGDGQQEAT